MIRKKRLPLVLWFVILVFCAVPGISGAVAISPDLQQALQSAGAAGSVSVIINLADKADLTRIAATSPDEPTGRDRAAGHDKIFKRSAVIKALMDKANLTQGFLRTFLQNRGAKEIKSLWIINAIAATLPASVISELMGLPGIESIELDVVTQMPPVLPAVVAEPGWNIARINAPGLWSAGITGSGVIVATLDTGVDATHPDLKSSWRGGACAVPPNCPSWFDPINNSVQPYDVAGSGKGHGTGTMGVILGASETEVYGVAPGAKWIAAKIFSDAGLGTDSAIHQAFQWILAPAGDPLNAPDLVNNSWGLSGALQRNICDPTFQPDIQALKAADIAVVFSAGNEGPNPSTSISPANLFGSFAVGATDINDSIASFSSRGPAPLFVPVPPSTDAGCDGSTFPNVVAPGVNIHTSYPGDSYKSWSGTSFSAPHVAGAMALLLSAFPSLTPAQLQTVLEQTATPLPPAGTVPNNDYGYGLIDVAAAYRSVFISGKGDIPQIAGIPSSRVFSDTAMGISSVAAVFTIANQGTAILTIDPGLSGVALTGPDSSDFSITGDTCSGNPIPSLGNCTVSVAFSPLSIGPKSAALTILSNDS
ncbi:MAG: S8 family serine peptidase, partial [Thermodesulfovibrionales bacterium]